MVRYYHMISQFQLLKATLYIDAKTQGDVL